MHNLKLSVVIISRNEAANIGCLIESILAEIRALSPQESSEIVLVDSASTDDTVAIATTYPIRVLQLSQDQHLSPSAGRYVGFQNSFGRYILFLDGDYELCAGWLPQALSIIEAQPDVAAVTGVRMLCPPRPKDTKMNTRQTRSVSMEPETHNAPKSLGGGGLFRRSVLEEVGSFNPYLFSEEEPELSLRIRNAGHRLAHIPQTFVYHYSTSPFAISTRLARRKRNLYLGAGQIIRYHLRSGLLWPIVQERSMVGLIPIVGLVTGVIALLVYSLTDQSLLLWLWGIAAVLFLGADFVRKRSLQRMASSMVLRFLAAEGIILGFFRKPHAPDTYLGQHTVIQ